MKTLKLAFLMLFFTGFFSKAQNKNELSVGIGPAFFGSGDVTGFALSASYAYPLGKHFSIEPRIINSAAARFREEIYYSGGNSFNAGFNYSQTGYLAASVSLVYTPFKGKGGFFKLKSGFLAGKMAHSYGMSREGTNQPSNVNFWKENLLGLIHTAHFRILNKQKFFIGSELSMLTSLSDGYYNCDGFVLNFMGGIKF